MTALTPRGSVLMEAVRLNFAHLAELEKAAPHDVDVIYRAMISHIRSARPQALLVPPSTEVASGG